MPDNSRLFIMLTDYNAKNTEIEGGKMHSTSGLVTTAAVENEIPNVNNQANKIEKWDVLHLRIRHGI